MAHLVLALCGMGQWRAVHVEYAVALGSTRCRKGWYYEREGRIRGFQYGCGLGGDIATKGRVYLLVESRAACQQECVCLVADACGSLSRRNVSASGVDAKDIEVGVVRSC